MAKDWMEGLPYGLPDNFDYEVIRSRGDVVGLIVRLPNADRGVAAREIWERRDRLGHRLAYTALMEVWDHDYRELVEAFETMDELAAALREVAPPLNRKRPLKVWRGIIVEEANPARAAISLSWTTSFDIACWFATRHDKQNRRSFVFELAAMPEEIITLHDTRGEREALLEPARLDHITHEIFVEGSDLTLDDLSRDSRAPQEALARWRAARDRYEAAIVAFRRSHLATLSRARRKVR
jgi:hypothetical protein